LAGFFATGGGGDGRLRSGLRWGDGGGCGDETMSLLAGGALIRMLFLAVAAVAVLAGTY
jgi:hypothetical protein